MTIRELLEASQLPGETEQLLEPGRLSPEEEERILALALAKAGVIPPEKGEEKPMKKSRFGLMVLAAALCAGTVAASAAAYFQMDKSIARTLGIGSESQETFFQEGGASIQASQECDGWDLTVNQAVGDRNCAYILLDLTAPEGTALDADLYQIDCRLDFDRSKGGVYGWEETEDEDRSDNRISFLIHATIDGDLRRTTGDLQVTGLRAVIFGEEEGGADDVAEQVADLQWAIRFPMEYQDNPVTYRPNQTVKVEKGAIQGSIKLEKVEITPLSVSMRFTSGDGILKRVEAITRGTPQEGAVLVGVKDREGNLILPDSTSGRDGWNSLNEVLTFQPIIDPDEIAALVLDGVEIPLEK